MPPLPSPFRAAVGLAATVVDEAKHLPDRSIELPMLAISRALKFSLHAQQRYSALTARGDEVLAARQTSDEPPPWATFDDPVDTTVEVDEAVTHPFPSPRPPSAQPSSVPPRPRPRKTVHAPRNANPSPFDVVDDEE